jgi:hypothetical protein
MRGVDTNELAAAHKALVKGIAMATLLTPEWLAALRGCDVDALPRNKAGDAEHLNYSQTWRYHTRQFVMGGKCAHCTKAGLDHEVATDLEPIAQDEQRAKLAIAAASAAGQSWGLISVRLGNNGIANGLWPESKVRSTFQAQAGTQHKGLRPAHKGGRWIADREELYADEMNLGTRRVGYLRKPDEALPERGVVDAVTEERKAELAAERAKKVAAHERSLKAIKAKYAALIKQG